MRYCTHCGKEIKPGTKFCTNCGTAFTENADKKEHKVNTNKKKSNKAVLLIAVSIVILLVVGAFAISKIGHKVGGFTDNNNIEEKKSEETKKDTAKSEEKTEEKSEEYKTEKKSAINKLFDKTTPIEDFTLEKAGKGYYIEKYNGTDKDIVIPSEYEGISIFGVAGRAFEKNECIESVVIPSSVSEIGAWAFDSCFNLKKVTIESGDTKLEISSNAFSNCVVLEELILPDRVASFGETMNCPSLKRFEWVTSDEIRNDKSNYSSKNITFRNCPSLSSCIIETGEMFKSSPTFIGCDSIKALRIPEGYSEIDGSDNNKNLETIVIPSTATTVDGGCDNPNLTNVVIKEGQDKAQLKGFENCTHLVKLDVPGNYEVLDMSDFPLSIEEVIWRDSGENHPNQKVIWGYEVRKSAKSIYLPRLREWNNNASGSDFKRATIYTYEDSIASEEAEKNGWPYEIITKMPDRDKSLKELEKKSEKLKAGEFIMETASVDESEIKKAIASIISESGLEISSDENDDKGNEDANKEKLVPTPAEAFVFSTIGYQNYTVISEYIGDAEDIVITPNISNEDFYIAPEAFAGNDKIRSVTIKGVAVDNKAFYGCTNLEEVTIIGAKDYDEYRSLANKYSLKEDAFAGCENLKTVHIKGAYLNWGKGAFKEDTSLTEIDIDDECTSIGEEAFMGCTALKSVRIPSKCGTILGNAFKDCTMLETIEWNSTVDTFLFSTTWYHSISMGAFENCSAIRKFDIPEKTSLNQQVFKGCSSLEEMILTQETWEASSGIPSECFMDCTSLKKVDIQIDVSQVKDYEVGMKAFSGCTSLEEIEIPKEVTSVNYLAFENCSSLKKAVWRDNEDNEPSQILSGGSFKGCSSLEDVYIPRLKNMVFGLEGSIFDTDTKVTVHTPEGSVMAEYCQKNNLKWSNN
ncbi:leucine-rich repeat domain-containing protein [Butyrivibrio sp. AE2015]|uniref:leucine-rich repeat domain-containing protein n=1 Tax=Butyrivibrio sp. AE2015 TaxID=1280663 RepID=UPI0003B73978|nr:leucine-rich repeat protein [Butyrivibrio sp. AE2015]